MLSRKLHVQHFCALKSPDTRCISGLTFVTIVVTGRTPAPTSIPGGAITLDTGFVFGISTDHFLKLLNPLTPVSTHNAGSTGGCSITHLSSLVDHSQHFDGLESPNGGVGA